MEKTLYGIDLQQLAHKQDIGLAIAWLIASHDLQTTAYLSKLNRDQVIESSDAIAEVHSASYHYLQRLYCSQVAEAIRLIQPSQNSATIKDLIGRNPESLDAFRRLQAVTKTDNTRKLLDRIRNKGTFHYCDYKEVHFPKWLEETVSSLAGSENTRVSDMVEYADNTFRCSFVDRVFDKVFVKNILELDTTTITEPDPVGKAVKSIFKIVSDIQIVAGGIASSIRDDACVAVRKQQWGM